MPHNTNYQDDLNNYASSSLNYRIKMIPYSKNNINREVYEKQDIVKNTKIFFNNSNEYLYDDMIDNEESYYLPCEENGINYKLLKP